MTSARRLEDAFAYCETLLRDNDKDRFLANLFVPAAVRPYVQALHAFSLEVARVRDVVSEPLPGELRHQWWRDALFGDARGDVAANPVAAALIDTIERFHLPRAPLIALIDARGFDLYDEPMPDLAALESYCRDTSSVLFRLVAAMLGVGAKEVPGREDGAGGDRGAAHGDAARSLVSAADQAGLAYAFTGLIRAFARHAARGQVYLPADLLRRHGSSHVEVMSGHATPALLAAIGEWRSQARRHLAAARSTVAELGESLKAVFLPLALVAPYLRQTEKRGYDPFRSPVELPQWRRQWALYRG